MPWTHVVAATDFGETGNGAIRCAAGLASRYGARLTLVHVQPHYPAPNPILGYYVETKTPEERAAELLRAREDLAGLVPSGTVFDTAVELGDDTAQRIVDVARRVGADLIVVGTHGRTGVGRMVLGSVAEHVVRSAPCAVLVVR